MLAHQRSFQRPFWRFVAVVLGVSVVAGCGGAAASPAPSVAAASPAPSGAAASPTWTPPAEPVTLTLWKGPHNAKEADIWAAVFADYTSTHPGIKLEYTVVPWEAADQTYQAAYAGGSPPDIAYMPDQFYVGYADQGLLADIGPYMASPSFAADLADFYPNLIDLGKYKGVQYGIPWSQGAYLIYRNLDMWNALGLPDPKTPEDVLTIAKQGTKPGVWGYLAPTSAADSAVFPWFHLWHNEGLNFLTPDWKAQGFNTPEGVKQLKFVTDFYCGAKVAPPAGQYTLPQMVDLFKSGKALMLDDGATDAVGFIGSTTAPGLSFKWDFILWPQGSKGNTVMGNSGFFVISKASKHQAEAFTFLQWLTKPDIMKKYILGKLSAYTPVRKGTADAYADKPVLDKMMQMKVGRVTAYEGMMHPKLRQIISAMWSPIEGSLSCKTDPAAALKAAGDAVDAVLKS